MKSYLRSLIVTALVVAAIGFQLNKEKQLEAAGPLSLREAVDINCTVCHANPSIRPPGEFSLMSGATSRTPGVVAQSLNITPHQMTAGEPRTSLLIRKPLEGSGVPHGGPKFAESSEVMQLLLTHVQNGAPANNMDRPAPAAVQYVSPTAVGNRHEILYVRRVFRPLGFTSLRSSSAGQNGEAGGDIWRMEFDVTTGQIFSDVNITNLPETDDVQHPALSLDGSKVVFSRKQPGDRWQIWECSVNGGSLRQITRGAGNKINPLYLSHLPDGSPSRSGEGGVVFLSDAPGFRDEYNTALTLSLHVADANGNNVRQLDFNPSHQLHPRLHSGGQLIFTRWEHNEHQGQNFMSLFNMSIGDYLSAGTNLFVAFGEHGKPGGNSVHETSEILDANYGQSFDLLYGQLDTPSHGLMIGRTSSRESGGGTLIGPFNPRLQGERNGPKVNINVIAQGDDFRMEPVDDINALVGWTYRNPRSLLNGYYIAGAAEMVDVIDTVDPFTGVTEQTPIYSDWRLYSFNAPGNPAAMQNFTLIKQEANRHFDDAIPVVVRPTPPRIGKPLDLSRNSGVLTSGRVMSRQRDGQPRDFTVDELGVVRFVRALQLSQGRIDTGRDNDEGIATQIVGEAPIHADGSFAAELPANVPIQFQLLDKDGHALVNHKPWISVAPGETARCVGCHEVHNKPSSVQTLLARQSPASIVSNDEVAQFNYDNDIQPIWDNKCIMCHDNAKVTGAPGRDRGLSLVGRWTPAGTTESFQELIGGGMMGGTDRYVRTQDSRASKLMWWLTGLKLNDDPQTAYPTDPVAAVNHTQMLTNEEMAKVMQWINTGVNFRVVDNDRRPVRINALNRANFTGRVWPIMQNMCVSCHTGGGSGALAMNLDGDPDDADSVEDIVDERIEVLSRRINFMIPEASLLLRKPLGESKGGMHHVGGELFTGIEDPNYMIVYDWILATNPSLAAAPPVTDLVGVTNYPNPFRDTTSFVYGLTGSVASQVKVKIYSQGGQLIRTLNGSTFGGATVGWNRVIWDGNDSNGKKVGNDVYFFVVDAEFGDGTKKEFRGKCVKVK